MVISISATLLLGTVVYLLWRYARLPLWQAATCTAFGYFLASSSLGPQIGDAFLTAARFIAGLDL
ncbi:MULTISPECIES: hypothetical protein [Catenuloplanes]|uniref:DUF2304 domain-containing protein n=1 Tax=Catenuloplanes niger TaxID=587534 RepID=A0AAE3ZPE0_9ACTN|nr:hypothetical protein [Catenuloplanes niger]MDR7322446.1 hypothetical protein [Catenuloplanes niger]